MYLGPLPSKMGSQTPQEKNPKMQTAVEESVGGGIGCLLHLGGNASWTNGPAPLQPPKKTSTKTTGSFRPLNPVSFVSMLEALKTGPRTGF